MTEIATIDTTHDDGLEDEALDRTHGGKLCNCFGFTS